MSAGSISRTNRASCAGGTTVGCCGGRTVLARWIDEHSNDRWFIVAAVSGVFLFIIFIVAVTVNFVKD